MVEEKDGLSRMIGCGEGWVEEKDGLRRSMVEENDGLRRRMGCACREGWVDKG